MRTVPLGAVWGQHGVSCFSVLAEIRHRYGYAAGNRASIAGSWLRECEQNGRRLADTRKGARMFGRRKSLELQTIAAIREEMAAADMRARAVLSNAMALIELRLSKDQEEREREQQSTEGAIELLRNSVIDNATGVGRLLEQVANMCAMVADRLEADRVERRALAEAITRLAQPMAELPEPSKVIGGTVVASSSSSSSEGELSLLDQGELSLIELEREEAVTREPPVSAQVGKVTEWPRLDRQVTDTIDVRQHKGTRLTAGRSSGDSR